MVIQNSVHQREVPAGIRRHVLQYPDGGSPTARRVVARRRCARHSMVMAVLAELMRTVNVQFKLPTPCTEADIESRLGGDVI